ncbi:SMI1/KNR4 family protein [Lampropedia aestuarii]|uniref:SMI1/KNR4 family protein n=1 Tax=Lampropedia aestuarii TaxID=2562762 RepID=UPI00246995FC|nr:SMI1/KNR4 family protein [Lampropedia aestuarii]MDH5857374.1 SMI1/KNR4 family protein [Lampropedia aestuarii]
MKALIDSIQAKPQHLVRAPKAITNQTVLALPDHHEIKVFYSLCDGIVFNTHSDYPLAIVESASFLPSNDVILGESHPEDISNEWYILAQGSSGEYLSYDLASQRQGQVYDSFIDRYGIAGSSLIIAQSLVDFLEKMTNHKASEHYWLADGFSGYGDAYD